MGGEVLCFSIRKYKELCEITHLRSLNEAFGVENQPWL